MNTDIFSFLAVWFRNLQNNVFKVQVINKDRNTAVVEERLNNVATSLDMVANEISKSSKVKSGEAVEFMGIVGSRLSALMAVVRDSRNIDLDRLERAVKELAVAVKKSEVKGEVSVSNLPTVQNIKGSVSVPEINEVIDRLEKLSAAVKDLKVMEGGEGGKETYTRILGGGRRLKLTDGVHNANLTQVGSSYALDVNVVQEVVKTPVNKYYTNSGAVTDGIVWSPDSSKKWYLTDIFIGVSAAATVTLEDDRVSGDAVVFKHEIAANSGWSHSFKIPLVSGEAGADLIVTTSAGNVYITTSGYEE